jgi:hypothetical protein
MLIVSATWEAVIRGSGFETSLGKNSIRPISKTNQKSKIGLGDRSTGRVYA